MAPTTYATFLAALAGLSVTGVTKKFTYPPEALSSADLPAMWPQLPRGDDKPMTFGAAGGWPELIADLCIAVEPVGQSLQHSNFDTTVTALDNLGAALRGADIGKGTLSWTIKSARITVAGIDYWGVVATVTGHG